MVSEEATRGREENWFEVEPIPAQNVVLWQGFTRLGFAPGGNDSSVFW